MKKGIIVNLKRFKLLNYVTLNKVFIVLCLLFIIGIFCGSVWLPKNTKLSDFSKSFFQDLIDLHSDGSFLKKFFNCFFRYFLLLVFYFLSGASAIGVAVTPFITVWQGILIGSITSQLYTQYGLSGIAFNAIILLPPLVIFVVCSFFAAKCAIEFSIDIAKLTMPKSRPNSLYLSFRRYCTNYLIFVAISIMCSLVEIFLNLMFLKFFNF